MIKVYSPKDCNNSPKRKIIYDSHLAYAKNDLQTFETLVTEDYEMEIVGDTTIYGWNNVKDFLSNVERIPKSLIIHQIISHGKYGAAHGTLVFDSYELAFSHFYEFASTSSQKIKKVTSYMVELKR